MNKKLIITCCALSLLACTGCMMPNRDAQIAKNEERIAAEGIVKLEAGDQAPVISAMSTTGQFDLSAALEEGRVVLFFFPAIYTPNSTRELIAVNKDLAEYAAQDITVYGITGASVEGLTTFGEENGIDAVLIADPGLEVAQAYGCSLANGKYPQRTVVGINSDGTIAFYLRHQVQKAELLEGFGLK